MEYSSLFAYMENLDSSIRNKIIINVLNVDISSVTGNEAEDVIGELLAYSLDNSENLINSLVEYLLENNILVFSLQFAKLKSFFLLK